MSNKLRRHERNEFSSKVWLTWDGGGVLKQAACKGLDISASGMRVTSPEPVPAGTYVNFRIHGTSFAGSGSIRSCAHERLRYLVGVEFSQSARWDPDRYPIGKPSAAPAPQAGAEEEPKTADAILAVEQ